jgi:hypothetical protein
MRKAGVNIAVSADIKRQLKNRTLGHVSIFDAHESLDLLGFTTELGNFPILGAAIALGEIKACVRQKFAANWLVHRRDYGMKKLLFLVVVVSAVFAGCSKQEDMSSPPASTNSASTNN